MSVLSLARMPAFLAECTSRQAPRGAPPDAGREGPAAVCRVAAAVVAAGCGVEADLLFAHGRCAAPVAAARQLAMYLVHVALGMPQAEVALAFGRDRSTVAHACRRVEDLRDRADFDARVSRMEASLRWALER